MELKPCPFCGGNLVVPVVKYGNTTEPVYRGEMND